MWGRPVPAGLTVKAGRSAGPLWVILVLLIGHGPGLWSEAGAQAERIVASKPWTSHSDWETLRELPLSDETSRTEKAEPRQASSEFLRVADGAPRQDGSQHKLRSLPTEYTIGAVWPSGDLGPTFESYLNQMADSLSDASLQFRLVHIPFTATHHIELAEAVSSGRFHFVFASAGSTICHQATDNIAPILSVEMPFPGSAQDVSQSAEYANVYAETGGLILARADNNEINSLADVKGKIIGGSTQSPITEFVLQANLLRLAGADTVVDTVETRWYFSSEDAINDLLEGNIDAAFATAGTLDALLATGQLKVLNEQGAFSRGGRRLHRMSTEPIPFWSLSAANHTDAEVISFVLRSLLMLNSTHPAAVAGGYHSFSPPLSHGIARNALREMNYLNHDKVRGWWCVSRIEEVYDLIRCPPEMTLSPFTPPNHLNCHDRECPLNSICLCKPCLNGTGQRVIPQASLDGHDTACERMEVCGLTEQNRDQQYLYIDGVFGRTAAAVKWRITDHFLTVSEDTQNPAEWSIEGLAQAVPGGYGFNLTASSIGTHLVEIFVDGVEIPESPFFLSVQRKACSDQGAHRETDQQTGACVCTSGTMEVGTGCVPQTDFFLVLLACMLVPAASAYWLLSQYHAAKADALWKIKKDDVKFSDPLQVLGRGTYGDVVKGTYKQMEVAIKQISDISYLTDSSSSYHPISGPDVSVHGTSAASFHANGFIHNPQSQNREMRLSRADRASSRDLMLTPMNQRASSFRSEVGVFTDAQLMRIYSLAYEDSDTVSIREPPGTPSSMTSTGFGRIPDGSSGFRSRNRQSSIIRVNLESPMTAVDRRSTPTADTSAERRPPPALEISTNPVKGPSPQASPSPLRTLSLRENSIRPNLSAELHFSNPVPGPGPASRRASNGSEDSFVIARMNASFDSFGVDNGNTSVSSDETHEPWKCWVVLRTWWEHSFFNKFWEAKAKHYDMADFSTDMRVLSKLRHPFIAGVIGAVLQKTKTTILLEYMQYGALSDILQNEIVIIDCEMTKSVLLDISSGLSFLHNYRPEIVHGDLKTGNVLVDDRFRAKISDFGLFLGGKKRVGKATSMAPEVLLGGRSTTFADIFAFGILMWEICTRRQPYEYENLFEALKAVADHRMNKRPDIPASIHVVLRNMMSDCWLRSPKARPCVVDLRRIIDGTPSSDFPEHSQHKLQHHRTQALLTDLLPRHVIEALMRGDEVKQDRCDCATVIFVKVVGLTSLSAEMSEMEIAQMLDGVFTQFDDLAAGHNVYRLETIGETYLGVTNLIEKQDGDHASRIARFALDIMDLAKKTPCNPDNPALGNITLRVGFECGPVVGGVVGNRQKKYTIFGNTVNTASRMESCTHEGTVQCTKTAAEILASQDPELKRCLHSRGKIHIKGRGDMHTYFLAS